MRIIGFSAGQPATWTVGGTMSVVALGAANGALGALIRLVTAALVPGPRWLESALFGSALAFLTLRGIQPVQSLSLALFMPLVVAYAIVLETIWRRRPHAAGHIAADAAWPVP
jgi:hypothetical protein